MTLWSIVEKYVGTPYRHGGRGQDGIDCLGLLICVYRDFGIEIPDGDGRPYRTDWHTTEPDRYLEGLLSIGKEATEPLKTLDLVYFRFHGGVVSHAGVMVDPQRFIHVLERRSVMVSRLKGMWRRKLAGARRLV